MSNYNRIEINLLPPELLPPPTVRVALIVNIALILGVLSYLGLTSYTMLTGMRKTQADIVDLQSQIAAKQPVVSTYTTLTSAKESVDKYGRLVSLASVDYVDVPVLLDRLAQVIPEGVYLSSVSNDKANPNSKSTVVQVVLMTSKTNPQLIQTTLQAFKHDTIFHECYMNGVEIHKEPVDALLANYGVTWQATGPSLPADDSISKYQFTILCNVPKIMDASNLPVIADQSVYLANVHFLTPPPEEEQSKKGAKGKGAKARKPGEKASDKGAANAPAGVKPTGVN